MNKIKLYVYPFTVFVGLGLAHSFIRPIGSGVHWMDIVNFLGATLIFVWMSWITNKNITKKSYMLFLIGMLLWWGFSIVELMVSLIVGGSLDTQGKEILGYMYGVLLMGLYYGLIFLMSSLFIKKDVQ